MLNRKNFLIKIKKMNTKEEDFYLLLERFYRYNDYFIEFSFYN